MSDATNRQPTAVICDDDAMSRQIARAVFEKAGFRVLAGVGTALEALDMVLDHHPDVLLLDLVMPGMSGEEILPSIKASSPETQVVIYSSYDPTYAVKSGAMFVVSKGQHGKLESTIERLAETPHPIAG
ncbi:MAG TPA: response regulator [Acidimicrobiales bacterium]|nr:response regulator [Acidimicrobiales bacterium]HVV35162.1 response regulator [Acidimicrobiales bacterium]